MGTIHCPGGHEFSDGAIPDHNLYQLIIDEKIDDIVASVANLKNEGDKFIDQVGMLITSASVPVYKCPICGRLLVFENGYGDPATSYKKELR